MILKGEKSYILIVDDDIDWRERFRPILEREGYNVYCAENHDKAIQVMNKKKIDLILLDIYLTGEQVRDGWFPSWIAFLKESSSRNIPVIVITGINSDIGSDVNAASLSEKAKKYSAAAILFKDRIDRNEFVETIKNVLRYTDR
ncbi:MAG: response regulator [Candidatus Electrothrix gigas]